jgi:hypothetical protein
LKEQERAERTVREAAASEERRKREEKRETLTGVEELDIKP